MNEGMQHWTGSLVLRQAIKRFRCVCVQKFTSLLVGWGWGWAFWKRYSVGTEDDMYILLKDDMYILL